MTYKKFVVYFIILLFLSSWVWRQLSGESIEISSNLSPTPTLMKKVVISNSDGLKSAIEKAIYGNEENYAIVVKNFGTSEEYFLNRDLVFEPASLYKLWVTAVALQKVARGELDENEILKGKVGLLNQIFGVPSDSLGLSSDEVITLTVSQAIKQTITISHNYAALLLADRVGVESVGDFLKTYGLINSATRNPAKTTAFDIALFYEKLYKGEILSKEYSDRMIDILSEQQLNDRIPKLLPFGLKVSHKTGELGNYKHDAGIIFSKYGDYVLVVLSNTNNPEGVPERIAQLSKAVYDYFAKKGVGS